MTAGIEAVLAAARRFDRTGFLPLVVDGRAVGWVGPGLAAAMARAGAGFALRERAVELDPALADEPARSRAFAATLEALAAAGWITGWRDELYEIVPEFGAHPLARYERAGARFLGIGSFAVHVNGLARRDGEPAMWIARRSLVKAVDPGMLDNLVGGGLASGSSISATLVKEGFEEAGFAPETMRRARPGRCVRMLRQCPEGVQSETIFVFDLELEAGEVPRNTDGEVAGFELLPLPEVVALIERGEAMTLDASLVALDALFRRGVLEEPPSPATAAVFAPFPAGATGDPRPPALSIADR